MTRRRTPRLATLPLERLGPGNDALLGDLAEEYRPGRSAFWYWRQALTAIVISASRDVWAHKSMALHAFSVLWSLPRLVSLTMAAQDPAQSFTPYLNVAEFIVATAAFTCGSLLAPSTGTPSTEVRP
jgi:hypothetical protein